MSAVCFAAHWPGLGLAALAGFVAGVLTERLYAQAKEKHMLPSRARWSAFYNVAAPFLIFACLLTSAYASVSTWHQSSVNHAQDVQRNHDQTEAIKVNQANSVVNCQNANQSRRASLALWTFLFDVSLKSPSATPAQKANVEAVQVWIGKLYADHDCNDLARKYPIPPPPMIHPAR